MLTKEQEKAAMALWSDKNLKYLQLVAGAGSGKTSTMIETLRYAAEAGYDLDKFCLITFTKKAALEMSERIKARGLKAGFIGTMHSLGYRILKKTLSKDGGFRILREKEKVLGALILELFPKHKHIPTDVLLKSSILNKVEREKLNNKYELYKIEKSYYDLDDLICKGTKALKNNKSIMPYENYMVDEFQDTSPDQVRFIQAMPIKKLFAVGDDWQSIYRFRNADVEISQNFEKYFPGASRYFLTKNFRSQKRIVQLGNRMIRLSDNYIRKNLKAHHKAAGKPLCHIIPKKVTPLKAWEIYLNKVLLKDNNQNSNSHYHSNHCGQQNNKQNDKKQGLTVLVRTNYLRLLLTKNLEKNIGAITRNNIENNIEVMTIHSSKGLEFENVLIFGIAKDVLPHKWNDRDEEIRLAYVAITRAKQNLEFLCWENETEYSELMPLLAKNCQLNYLTPG